MICLSQSNRGPLEKKEKKNKKMWSFATGGPVRAGGKMKLTPKMNADPKIKTSPKDDPKNEDDPKK